jgi:hypothetical protein
MQSKTPGFGRNGLAEADETLRKRTGQRRGEGEERK